MHGIYHRYERIIYAAGSINSSLISFVVLYIPETQRKRGERITIFRQQERQTKWLARTCVGI